MVGTTHGEEGSLKAEEFFPKCTNKDGIMVREDSWWETMQTYDVFVEGGNNLWCQELFSKSGETCVLGQAINNDHNGSFAEWGG